MKKILPKEKELREKVVGVLKTIYDPELPVDIYALGLIYGIDIDLKKKELRVVMTLTTPSCPVADSLPNEVKKTLESLPDFSKVEVSLTFDPPYSTDRMSQETKIMIFGGI